MPSLDLRASQPVEIEGFGVVRSWHGLPMAANRRKDLTQYLAQRQAPAITRAIPGGSSTPNTTKPPCPYPPTHHAAV